MNAITVNNGREKSSFCDQKIMMKKNHLGVAFYKIDDKFSRIKNPHQETHNKHIYDYQIPSLSESLGSDAFCSIAYVDCRLGDRPVPVGT
jgi:hypothetical protein